MRLVINTDGSVRHGFGGVGAVIREDTDQGLLLVREEKAFIGAATTDIAEYEALLLGLRTAQEMGATSVELRTDHLLMVEQVKGDPRVHEHNKERWREARRLAASFAEFHIIYVHRTENADADRLARRATGATPQCGMRKRRGT